MTRYGIDMGENETVTIITESRNLRPCRSDHLKTSCPSGRLRRTGWKGSRENFDILELQAHRIKKMLYLSTGGGGGRR